MIFSCPRLPFPYGLKVPFYRAYVNILCSFRALVAYFNTQYCQTLGTGEIYSSVLLYCQSSGGSREDTSGSHQCLTTTTTKQKQEIKPPPFIEREETITMLSLLSPPSLIILVSFSVEQSHLILIQMLDFSVRIHFN